MKTQADSRIDKAERTHSLFVAGWTEDKHAWTHPHVGGVHNMRSAEKITAKWIG